MVIQTLIKLGEYHDVVAVFRGTQVSVDVRRVVEMGISPWLNTGITAKGPRAGQVGAGLLHAPMECIVQAFEAMRTIAV